MPTSIRDDSLTVEGLIPEVVETSRLTSHRNAEQRVDISLPRRAIVGLELVFQGDHLRGCPFREWFVQGMK